MKPMPMSIDEALEDLAILRGSEFEFFIDTTLYGGALRAYIENHARRARRRICPLFAYLYVKKKKWRYYHSMSIPQLARELDFTIEATDTLLWAADKPAHPYYNHLAKALGTVT